MPICPGHPAFRRANSGAGPCSRGHPLQEPTGLPTLGWQSSQAFGRLGLGAEAAPVGRRSQGPGEEHLQGDGPVGARQSRPDDTRPDGSRGGRRRPPASTAPASWMKIVVGCGRIGGRRTGACCAGWFCPGSRPRKVREASEASGKERPGTTTSGRRFCWISRTFRCDCPGTSPISIFPRMPSLDSPSLGTINV